MAKLRLKIRSFSKFYPQISYQKPYLSPNTSPLSRYRKNIQRRVKSCDSGEIDWDIPGWPGSRQYNWYFVIKSGEAGESLVWECVSVRSQHVRPGLITIYNFTSLPSPSTVTASHIQSQNNWNNNQSGQIFSSPLHLLGEITKSYVDFGYNL